MPQLGTLIAFTPDTVAEPSEVNQNFTDIRGWANASAAIKDLTQTVAAAWTFSVAPIMGAGLQTDTVLERTAAAGVTIDSVLLKDGGVRLDNAQFLKWRNQAGTLEGSVLQVWTTNDTFLDNPFSQSIIFRTSGAERLRIAAAGTVTFSANVVLGDGVTNRTFTFNGSGGKSLAFDSTSLTFTATGNPLNFAGDVNFANRLDLQANEAVRLTHTSGYIAFIPGGGVRRGYLQQNTTEVLLATENAANFRYSLAGRILVNANITAGTAVGDVVLGWNLGIYNVNSANTQAYNLIRSGAIGGVDAVQVGSSPYPLALGGPASVTGAMGGDVVIPSSRYLYVTNNTATGVKLLIGAGTGDILRLGVSSTPAASGASFTADRYIPIRLADDSLVYIPCRNGAW